MTDFEDAIKMISGIAKPFETEIISLEDADNRILAEDIYADRDYPPFNRSAMDGYAIMYSDWENGIRKYNITEILYAGQESKKSLESGSCYKIMTGAATPEQADLIVKKEETIESDLEVTLLSDNAKRFQNIAKKGEDIKKNTLILPAPSKCTPQVISLLAAVGKASIQVYKLPEVAIITTGNEVITPGKYTAPYQIRNSNQYLLKSLLKNWNITPQICQHIEDDENLLAGALKKALKKQIVIINGGVSAGDADHVPSVLNTLGVKKIFHKVKMRPGKPIWVGKTDTGNVVFALPGNPLSCLTTFTVFVEDYLYKCFGYKCRYTFKLPLLEERQKRHPLIEFFPSQFHGPSQGLNLISYNGSGDITAGVSANGLAVQEATQGHIKKNEMITFYPFRNSQNI